MPFWTAQIPVLYSTVWLDCTLETDRAGHTTRGRCLGDDCPDTGDACVRARVGMSGQVPRGALLYAGRAARLARSSLVCGSQCPCARVSCRSLHIDPPPPPPPPHRVSNCAPLSPCVDNVTPGPPGYIAHDASRLRADQSFLSSPTTITGVTGLVGLGFNAPLDTV